MCGFMFLIPGRGVNFGVSSNWELVAGYLRVTRQDGKGTYSILDGDKIFFLCLKEHDTMEKIMFCAQD